MLDPKEIELHKINLKDQGTFVPRNIPRSVPPVFNLIIIHDQIYQNRLLPIFGSINYLQSKFYSI